MEGIKESFRHIRNHIEKESGKVVGSKEEVAKSIAAAEKVAGAMLGCTLQVKQKAFVIRMVELYYGGVGDEAHDWYRNRFVYKTSKYKDRSSVQSMDGFRVYIATDDMNDTYNRCDIVIGNEGVPVSLLIRSVWDRDHNRIGEAGGSPFLVLKALGLDPSHHNQPIAIGDDVDRSELRLWNTQGDVLMSGYEIHRQRRKQGSGIIPGIEDEDWLNCEWNFYLAK